MARQLRDREVTTSDRFLSIDQVAEVLGFSRKHIYDLMAKEVIPFVKIGTRRRIPGRIITDLVEEALGNRGHPERDELGGNAPATTPTGSKGTVPLGQLTAQ